MKPSADRRSSPASRTRRTVLVAAACFAASRAADAQVVPAPRAAAQPPAAEAAWALNASVNAYFVPDGRDYLDPVVTADHNALHLEARYNYEAYDTGSVWVGWNLHFGDALSLDVTPMVGGVFGALDGFAPGYSAELAYGKLALSSSGEYVIDATGTEGNFFYTWTQLTFAPWTWLQVGAVVQRTRAYETGLDVQRGFLVGFTYKDVNLVVNVFNPDRRPTVVLAVGVAF